MQSVYKRGESYSAACYSTRRMQYRPNLSSAYSQIVVHYDMIKLTPMRYLRPSGGHTPLDLFLRIPSTPL